MGSGPPLQIGQMKLLKHKDGMTSHGLQGAVFQLLRGTGTYDDQTGEEIKEPMKWGKSWSDESGSGNVGENITFTTDDNGYCLIALNQSVHGAELELGVHYFLKEVESPAGYKIDSSVEYWEFTLTDVPEEVNYGEPDEYGNREWIYFYYDDVMKMANTPTEDPIEVSVDKYWFDENGDEITEENLNTSFVAKVQLLRKTDDEDYVPVKVEYNEGSGDQPIITELAEGDTSGQVELNMGNSWAYSWNNLPRTVHQDDRTIRYTYKIEGTKTVTPQNVRSLVELAQQYQDQPMITLITCTPLGTSKYRLLVYGTQISPSYDDAATASPDTGEDDGTTQSFPENDPSPLEQFWRWLTGQD